MEMSDTMKRQLAMEAAAVRELGQRIGFGAIMHHAMKEWRSILEAKGMAGGEFVYGPCAAAVVPCTHLVKDSNSHCEVCCGAGHVTKWVSNFLAATASVFEPVDGCCARCHASLNIPFGLDPTKYCNLCAQAT